MGRESKLLSVLSRSYFHLARRFANIASANPLVKILESEITRRVPSCPDPNSLAAAEFAADPTTSRILCSDDAQLTISAYEQESDIGGVPLEKRKPAQEVFQNFLKLSVHNDTRRRVLCNLGTRGTGKTVLQAFNMLWFVKEKPDGLAIEVTFNDDQGGGMWEDRGDILGGKSLQCAIGLRILHRAVVKKCNSNTLAKSIITDAQEQLLEQLSSVSAQEPMEMALQAARHLAGASETAPVLLAVDELIKAVPYDKSFSTSKMMTHLGLLLDTKSFRDPPVYLAVTTYLSTDLSRFATDSNRPLMLQPLPPLLPAMPTGLTHLQAKALPLMLRVLATEATRKALPPSSKENNYLPRSVLGRVSQLLQAAGGHPRRLRSLLNQLATFTDPAPPTDRAPDRQWGEKFVTELNNWLNDPDVGFEYCKDLMNHYESFQFNQAVDLGGLAAATAVPFEFPLNSTTADQCRPFLEASKAGMCQFISPGVGLPSETMPGSRWLRGFAYIPLPVLQKINKNNPTEDKFTSPSIDALNALTTALTAFGDDGAPQQPYGKSFEDLIEATLVLFLLHNPLFTLSQLCGGSTPLLTTSVRGGPTTIHRKDVEYFPLHPHGKPTPGGTIPRADQPWNARSAKQLIDTFIRSGKTPLFFRPFHKSNVSGDMFCLLPRAGRQTGALLVVVQCKAHFNPDPPDQSETLEKWRTGRKYFTDSILAYTHGLPKRHNPIPQLLAANNITPVFLLFCTNPVDTAEANLGADEGVVDLVRMRSWLPTAAFAAECATVLRALFRTSVEEEEEEQEQEQERKQEVSLCALGRLHRPRLVQGLLGERRSEPAVLAMSQRKDLERKTPTKALHASHRPQQPGHPNRRRCLPCFLSAPRLVPMGYWGPHPCCFPQGDAHHHRYSPSRARHPLSPKMLVALCVSW
eukprot:m.177423 g.177423  ORF g.177423 m.177423 type:complete len:917 (-) comp15350_c1_seq6:187-2937(-)